MYLIALTFGLCLSYFVFTLLFSAFFKNQFAIFNSRSLYSVILIVIASVIIFSISLSISDIELSNRVLHALGGGFLTFFVCFLAFRDSRVAIGKFQFLVFSILLVTTLGVANEILEFFLQSYFHLPFSLNPNDTWLDLISNTVGLLLGAIILAPFVGRKSRPSQTGLHTN